MNARPSTLTQLGRAALLFAALTLATRANAAAPVHVTLPTIDAPPGATVVVPIDVDQDLTSFAITSIGYRLTLDPAFIVSATFNKNNGLITNWGPPFTNVTSTEAGALGVGFTPIVSTARRVQIVYLTLSPSVPVGTNIPLAFQSFVLNDGSPAVTLGTGLIRVRNTVDVAGPVARGLALGAPAPNPVRGAMRVALSIPDDGLAARANVDVLDLAGRRVRAIVSDVLAPGAHEVRWDGRDAAGSRVPAGLYWLRLERGGMTERRAVVVLK